MKCNPANNSRQLIQAGYKISFWQDFDRISNIALSLIDYFLYKLYAYDLVNCQYHISALDTKIHFLWDTRNQFDSLTLAHVKLAFVTKKSTKTQ